MKSLSGYLNLVPVSQLQSMYGPYLENMRLQDLTAIMSGTNDCLYSAVLFQESQSIFETIRAWDYEFDDNEEVYAILGALDEMIESPKQAFSLIEGLAFCASRRY